MSHEAELAAGDRFRFGENWWGFLKRLNDERIRQAEKSLLAMLEMETLSGKTFVDIGCGSGLFSLAARRLGATVVSFDFDPSSVRCAAELKRRYFPDDGRWTVSQGSVLDQDLLQSLGRFDIVYSWGVLHHTGSMWQALENVAPMVGDQGLLFIAIYNDQGGWSKRWRWIKHTYNRLPSFLQPIYAILVMGPRDLKILAAMALQGRPLDYFRNIARYSESSTRGMNYWHDLLDWVGGYPFEVAKPEQIFGFFRKRGFGLRQLRTWAGGVACNEFVMQRLTGDVPTAQAIDS